MDQFLLKEVGVGGIRVSSFLGSDLVSLGPPKYAFCILSIVITNR